MARFASCNVARRFLKESGYLPIRFDEFRLEEGMTERLAELLEELRAQQFLGNGKVIQQKVVVVGDSNAEELAAGINGARVFGKSTQAVAAELYDVILGGAVKLVIVAVGRDDIHKGIAMEQIIGNVKAIISTLAQYKHAEVFILPPPWMPMYTAEYCAFVAAMHKLTGSDNIPELGEYEWNDDAKKELADVSKSNAVLLHRYKGRDFIEMSRMGTGHFRKWADINGHLTELATRTIVEVLQETLKIEGLKLSEHAASGSDDKRGEKRVYYNSGGFRGGHGKRDRRRASNGLIIPIFYRIPLYPPPPHHSSSTVETPFCN